MIIKLRNSIWTKSMTFLMVYLILFPVFFPPQAAAITGGPSQPEFSSFTPIGVSDMVDPFSGDFSYNIPLLDVGGYPINISYSSGVAMEQQATCVGLGWNLSAAGVINRSMRGIPDDFNGEDKVINKTNMKPNTTVGANVTVGDIEIVGLPFLKLSAGMGLFYNNYTGVGVEANIEPALAFSSKNGYGLNLGLGLSANSKEGIGVSPKVGLSYTTHDNSEAETTGIFTNSLGLAGSYNSRAGLKSIAIDASSSYTVRTYEKTVDEDGNDVITKNDETQSANGSSAIPIGINTYIPQLNQSMLTSSVSINIGTGLEGFWTNGKLRIGGYFNRQRVAFPIRYKSAFGYLYADKGASNPGVMHDFNREKDGAFSDNTPAMAMTQMTYDIYTASGQGVSGMFRPHRDFGTIYDPFVLSISDGKSFGGDLGATAIFKAGININLSFSLASSGRWTENSNPTRGLLSFNGKVNDATYEPFYFRSAGEFTTIDENYFNKIQGLAPVRITINKDGYALNQYKKRASMNTMTESQSNILSNRKLTREKRNQPMSMLPASVAAAGGFDKKMASYEFTDPDKGISNITDTDRVGPQGRKGHHISEVTVTRPDGARYIYGQQAYNFKQCEVSFNTSKTPEIRNGFVGYDMGQDNTINNDEGIDHYFSSTELPPYATAYQLTTVLSVDYVDLKGDGATPDDLGTYTKFNYTTLFNKNNPYRWRNPYKGSVANFSEGYKAKMSDNKGNYVYGEKEIKNLHSIETKNYIAEFHYSDRKDAFDVAGENGGQGANALKKLDRVVLYTRCDRVENKENAVPLKTVHFAYDYSLCQNLPSNNGSTALTENEMSNDGGKLTLKKIFFTYENSKKGQLSPYVFHYGDADHDLTPEANLNPDYDFRGNDRWGNYKPNNGVLANSEDPYVIQGESNTNIYAAAWSMTTIQLPSGGLIKVDLEADDYAYIQDKRATRMFTVKGFSKQANQFSSTLSDLYTRTGSSNYNNNLYMYFDAPDASSQDDFRKRYIGEGRDEIKELFFKFFIDITGKNDYEYIPGYATVEGTGWDAATKTGWLKIKYTTLKDNGKGDDIHPIAKTAMQFVRMNLPEFLFGKNPEDADVPGEQLLYEVIGLLTDVKAMITGINTEMRRKGFGQKVDLEKSFIRLQTPNYKKLGGGVRVNKITINDQWGTISGNTAGDFDYGQTYEYFKVADDPTASIAVGDTISSGVAVYEPFIGNEENPLRQPVAYSEDRKMAPDNDFYQETPYGEMFYPSPSVGYSQVKVTNLSRENVERTATGHIIHQFYTAKDFPVKVRKPRLERKPNPASFLNQLFKINIKDYMTASQSYAIELNNMHGKQKAQFVYAEGQANEISSVEYFYKQQNSGQIDNNIKVIDKNGNVTNTQAGLDIDMVTDERESKNFTFSAFIPGNLDISPLPPPFPIPIPLPSVWPKISRETTRFRGISNTKVITRYGILEKTKAFDLGSYVTTENLAWDKETGEILVTRTQNDFEDPVYAFTYPAHWSYDGMGQAYKNIGVELTANSTSINLPQNYFAEGDEVLIKEDEMKVWVTKVDANAGSITLVDIDGEPVSISGAKTLLVLRSGRRNQHSTPVGSVTTLSNPIEGNQINGQSFKNVINAGAVEFKHIWDGYCECDSLLSSKNPYINGQRGNYRPLRSHVYLTGRTQSDQNRNTNIRKDGIFEDFEAFWSPNNGNEWKITDGKWTFASEVTLVSPYGFELENKDALNRYSSADYGYNNTLPVAVASNARYKEIGNDNFEDYDCSNCPDDHFSFKLSASNVTEIESHTGRKSIKVGPGATVEVERIINPCGNEGDLSNANF